MIIGRITRLALDYRILLGDATVVFTTERSLLRPILPPLRMLHDGLVRSEPLGTRLLPSPLSWWSLAHLTQRLLSAINKVAGQVQV